MKSFSGFTLIELLISITIISMMAALSISAYPKFSEQISISGDTYKALAYFRETQSYGISAVTTPGIKFIYSFQIDKAAGTFKRYKIESPTDRTNTYYINSSSIDSGAPVITIRSTFEISQINGIKGTATTSLDKAYAFFKRPNPEARLSGTVGSSNSISPDTDTTSFDRIEVTIRSKRTPDFQKKVIILNTGQMYVNDW